MRDNLGRFKKNHPVLTDRDKTTGRFIKTTTDKEQDRYLEVSQEVNEFLKNLEGSN